MNRMIDIDGHPTWVDDRGAGDETVVLLHGGMSHSGLLLDAFGDALTDRYRVVSFDRRGCGRTADPGGPFHYADMATDTIGVLELVVGGAAHLVGWSDGGIIAVLVALRRPDLIRRTVIIGTNVHHDAALPVDVDPDGPFFTRIRDDYAALSPDGADHFDDIAERFGVMVSTEPTMTPDDLAGITAPTLVIGGDDDFFGLDAHVRHLRRPAGWPPGDRARRLPRGAPRTAGAPDLADPRLPGVRRTAADTASRPALPVSPLDGPAIHCQLLLEMNARWFEVRAARQSAVEPRPLRQRLPGRASGRCWWPSLSKALSRA